MELMNYSLTVDYPDVSLEGKTVVNTINPHSYCVSRKDPEFQKALLYSDILLPDGIGIVWAARVLNRQKIEKIAGYDIFVYLMRYLNEAKGSCFFLGASEETLKRIKERANREYPDIEVNFFSPPYKTKFTDADSALMRLQVNTRKPNVLFVGMTAPKQEKWVKENKDLLESSIICSIGAVFDFYAGTVKRPGPFWIKAGLEWLPRFLKDPKRLARRNLISTPLFILEVLHFKLFKKGFL